MEGSHKRIRLSDSKEGNNGEGEGEGEGRGDHCVEIVAASEEMELQIQRILDKINSFTQQVSEILEAGKALFKDLSTEFEERLVSIHREQVEKWEEEMKEIRTHDTEIEAARSVLHNAQSHLFQNACEN